MASSPISDKVSSHATVSLEAFMSEKGPILRRTLITVAIVTTIVAACLLWYASD